MPEAGTKCPDCGYRFKERRDLQVAASTLRDRKSGKMLSKNEQVKVYRCPGTSNKGQHPPKLVEIQRIEASDTSELVKMKIISAGTAALLEEFTDEWREANRRKYRPDIIFGVAKSK